MPLEGHWQRTNTPLRKLTLRERRVVVWGTLATAIVLLALVLATAGDRQPDPAAGCIRASIAGRTGAELINGCGQRAVALCRRAAGRDEPWATSVSDACRAAAIEF